LFLDLCSDAAGTTIIESYDCASGFTVVVNLAMRRIWRKGSALPSTVQSIAFRFASDPGAMTFAAQDLFATKPVSSGGASIFDAITPNSGTAIEDFVEVGDERLYAIAGITADDTYVLATNGGAASRNDNAGPGYGGATGGAMTTYVWEGIPVDLTIGATNNIPTEDGSSGSRSTLRGGYDTTAMTTREAFTILTDYRPAGTWSFNRSYWDIEHIVLIGASPVFTNAQITDFHNCGVLFPGSAVPASSFSRGLMFDKVLVVGGVQLRMDAQIDTQMQVTNSCVSSCNAGGGILSIRGGGIAFRSVVCENGVYGLQMDSAAMLDGQPVGHDLTTIRNTSASIRSQSQGSIAIKGASLNEATEWSAGTRGSRCYVQDLDTVGNNAIFDFWGRAVRQTAVVNGSEPDALAVTPTSSTEALAEAPFIPHRFIWKLTGGAANTLTVACRRNDAGLNLGIRYNPVQQAAVTAGLTTQVEGLMTAAIDTWEDLTITLTPSIDVTVGIEVIAWGGTANIGYVGKFRVS
jgi:hypothetical protein